MCESPSVSHDDEKPGVGQSEYLTSRVAYLGLVRRTRRPAATPTPSNTDNTAVPTAQWEAAENNRVRCHGWKCPKYMGRFMRKGNVLLVSKVY